MSFIYPVSVFLLKSKFTKVLKDFVNSVKEKSGGSVNVDAFFTSYPNRCEMNVFRSLNYLKFYVDWEKVEVGRENVDFSFNDFRSEFFSRKMEVENQRVVKLKKNIKILKDLIKKMNLKIEEEQSGQKKRSEVDASSQEETSSQEIKEYRDRLSFIKSIGTNELWLSFEKNHNYSIKMQQE